MPETGGSVEHQTEKIFVSCGFTKVGNASNFSDVRAFCCQLTVKSFCNGTGGGQANSILERCIVLCSCTVTLGKISKNSTFPQNSVPGWMSNVKSEKKQIACRAAWTVTGQFLPPYQRAWVNNRLSRIQPPPDAVVHLCFCRNQQYRRFAAVFSQGSKYIDSVPLGYHDSQNDAVIITGHGIVICFFSVIYDS